MNTEELKRKIEQEARTCAAQIGLRSNSDEYNDVIAAYTAGATHYAEEVAKMSEENQRLTKWKNNSKALHDHLNVIETREVDEEVARMREQLAWKDQQIKDLRERHNDHAPF